MTFVGGSILGKAYFPSTAQSVTLASVDTPGFEVEGGVIEGSTLSNVKLKEGNYQFVDSQIASVDFDFEESVVISDNARLYNCTFGLQEVEPVQCYCVSGNCGGCAIPAGNYSNNLADYAVKMNGSNPALYDSVIIAENGTAVLIDKADGAILQGNVIEATQGVYVNQSTNAVIEFADFTPLEFSVNWALRESFVGDDEYHECSVSIGLSEKETASFAGGAGGGQEYLPCWARTECNIEYLPGELFNVCGCYSSGEQPYGCTDDPIIQSYKQCEPSKYCYGNWDFYYPSAPYYPGYPQGHICSGTMPAGSGYQGGGNPDYDSCLDQGFPMGVCSASAPDGYSSCGGSECDPGKNCYCPIGYPSCSSQGFGADAVCSLEQPLGYYALGGEACGYEKECYAPIEIYLTCQQQGFQNAVCSEEAPEGWFLAPGSEACGEEKECYYNPLQQIGPCEDPGDCVASIPEECVVESVPFIVVDGSSGVQVRESVFDAGVIIDVEADSSIVYLNDNEFQGDALIFLRGDGGEFKNNEFAAGGSGPVQAFQYVGIDVLGNDNQIRNLGLTDSKGIVLWGNGNSIKEAALGGAGVSYEGADYNVVDRGEGNSAYGVESPNAGLLLKPVETQAAGVGTSWDDSFYAFSEFDGVRLEDSAFARYLSGQTGELNFVDYGSELQREWNYTVSVISEGEQGGETPVPAASVSFASSDGMLSGSGVADESGYVEFNVTQGVFDKDLEAVIPEGWNALSFEAVDYNPYSFTASGAGYEAVTEPVTVESDGGVAISLIGGSYLTCAEQGYSGSTCTSSAPEGYGVCGGEPYSGEECGDGLICYCPVAVQPSPEPQEGVFLVAIEPNRAQLPGSIPIKVSLQYEGVPLCVGGSMVVTVTGAGVELPATFVDCDPAYGLHEFTVELHEPGQYLVEVSAVSGEFEGTARAENEFYVIAQQPVATPDLHLLFALLAGLAASYAVRKR